MPHFRPPLRFSLRTLFVLVTILCILMGYQLNWIRQRDAALRQRADRSAYFVGGMMGPSGSSIRTKPAPLCLRVFGAAGYFQILVHKQFATAETVTELQELFPEAEIIVME